MRDLRTRNALKDTRGRNRNNKQTEKISNALTLKESFRNHKRNMRH